MRILFASGRGGGHITPMVPFAHAYERAGHEVTFAAPGSARGLVERAGLRFRAVGEAPDRARHWAPVFTPGAAPGMVHVIQELFVRLDARAALPRMLKAAEEIEPDLIVRETTEFASAVAAERFGVPTVQIGVHLASSTDSDERLLAIAAPALAELGLSDTAALAAAPVLTCAPAALDSDANGRVRRFRTPTLAPRAPENLVYVSFGSEAPESIHFPALYRDAAEALADLPVRVLMTIGDRRDPEELGPLPANVHVRGWVDQHEVMRRAKVMVGHGGSGSTLAALAAGVPLALVPLFVDGPDNARRVEQAGAGLIAGDLRATVTRLLADERYTRAAQRIAGEIAALPPVDEAV